MALCYKELSPLPVSLDNSYQKTIMNSGVDFDMKWEDNLKLRIYLKIWWDLMLVSNLLFSCTEKASTCRHILNNSNKIKNF